jgi:hypothetical protein
MLDWKDAYCKTFTEGVIGWELPYGRGFQLQFISCTVL